MRPETVSDKPAGILNPRLYQLDKEASPAQDLETSSQMDRILGRLDQIERLSVDG